MHRCAKCKTLKENSFFNKDKNQKSGLYPYCKECRKPLVREWSKTHREKHKIQSKEYRLRHVEKAREATKKWRSKNRYKKNTHLKVLRAIRAGIIKKSETCLNCEKKPTQGHHINYKFPLFVLWLCPQCHKDMHTGELKIDNFPKQKLELETLEVDGDEAVDIEIKHEKEKDL